MSVFLKIRKIQNRELQESTLKLQNAGYSNKGHRELIKQPLTEAFICMKWEKLNWAFYLALVYRLILAIGKPNF